MSKNRLNEVRLNNQGLEMKIIEYHSSRNITVEFIDSKKTVENVMYHNFIKGSVLEPDNKPQNKAENRLNEVRLNNQGLEMKIIAYRSCDDIDILFPKYNYISTNKRYWAFKNGQIYCPELDRIGEKIKNNDGDKMEIIAYTNASDIDVLFPEYGLKVEHERYEHFKAGSISRPTYVTINNEQYIVCGECKEILKANLDNFRKHSEGKLGLSTICKICAREKERIYREQNPHIDFNKKSKRRSKLKNQGRGISKKQYYEMMNFFDWRCAYTGKLLNKFSIEYGLDNYDSFGSIDHIIPLKHYGLNEIWNLVPCNYRANSSKSYSKDWKIWYRKQDFYSKEREDKIEKWIEYAWNTYGDNKKFKQYAFNKWNIKISSFINSIPKNTN